MRWAQRLMRPLYQSLRYNRWRVVQQSPFDNIYHCCTQRTASQWFRAVFRDPVVFKYCGLRPIPYVQLGLKYAHFERAFPRHTIGVHLYIGYDTFWKMPKAGRYRAFFVLRDPRDIVVSWYYAVHYSHAAIDPIPQLRQAMAGLDKERGICFCIDTLARYGLFAAQRSWVAAQSAGEDVRIFYYESLAESNSAFLAAVLDYLQVNVPPPELAALAQRCRFAAITGGRRQGEESIHSHYRKGIAGDWVHHFTPTIADHFRAVTGYLVEELGYAP